MAQTPVTSATSYLSAARLLDFIDWRIVADCVRDDDGTRPTKAQLLGTPADNEYELKVVAALEAGSGHLESACLPRGQYTPEDLAGLTGMGKAHMERVVAGLTILALFSRRYPSSGQRDGLPAVVFAEEELERLRLGEHVFGLALNIAAGAGMSPIRIEGTDTGEPDRHTVETASRFFGHRGE